MKRLITNLIKDESGQDLVEYALLLGVVAVASVATLGTLFTAVSGSYSTTAGKITSAS
jgi:pilus assembly protein Flp/PilA